MMQYFDSFDVKPIRGLWTVSLQFKDRNKQWWAGHVVRMGEKRNAYGILVGKLKRKRPLVRPRRRRENHIRIDLREIVWESVDHVVQDRYQWRALVNTVMNLRVGYH
jgi:hypothetical protein